MQKETEQRIREMQSRARLLGESENHISAPKNMVFHNSSHQDSFLQSPLQSVFGGIENDKLVILALLWILWNEHADSKLILALLYLLL